MVIHPECQYLGLLESLVSKLKNTSIRDDRTGVGCVSRFGDQMKFDLSSSFPLLTTKRVWWKGVAEELFWFLRGETNIKSLQDKGVHIWDEWATESGEVGPMYGSMWRSWPLQGGLYIDQILEVIKSIRNIPNSRRHIVSAWNAEYTPSEYMTSQENVDTGFQALAPCHCLFQFFVEDGRLSCQLYQRSADIFLGVPFNIASYSLLTYIIADICYLKPGEFIHTFGDLHLYSNHLKQAEIQLERTPFAFPKLQISKKLNVEDLYTLKITDFSVKNYVCHETIKADIAV